VSPSLHRNAEGARAEGTLADLPEISGVHVVKTTATVHNSQQLTVTRPGSLVPIGGGAKAKANVMWDENVALIESLLSWESLAEGLLPAPCTTVAPSC
jgi:hypothetical protein